MTRTEMLAKIADIHAAWSLRYGDSVPYVAEDESPHDGQMTDLSVWQADRSAPPEIDDELNEAIKQILAQIDDEPAVAAATATSAVLGVSLYRRIDDHLPGRHNQKSHGGGGGGNGELTDEQIEAAYNYTDPKTGISAKVVNIDRETGNIGVEIKVEITDHNGKRVGYATRVLPSQDSAAIDEGEYDDVKYARHDEFGLQPGMQGQGFATRWNSKVEDAYRQGGIEEIRLGANIDVGGYAWARAGFDFNQSTGTDYRADIASRATRLGRNAPAVVQQQIVRVTSNPNATPLDFAMIGYTAGAATWPGKEIMLGSVWQGVKRL